LSCLRFGWKQNNNSSATILEALRFPASILQKITQMTKPKDYIRDKSQREGEFIFEQWAKYLNLHILDHDILHDFEPESEKVGNITAEKLRCVFSQGYRFAMLQILQKTKYTYNFSMDHYDAAQLIKILENQQNFIYEKIEDSFLLNKTDGKDGRIISRNLKDSFQDEKRHDFLNW
jgi:hypothetical protein